MTGKKLNAGRIILIIIIVVVLKFILDGVFTHYYGKTLAVMIADFLR